MQPTMVFIFIKKLKDSSKSSFIFIAKCIHFHVCPSSSYSALRRPAAVTVRPPDGKLNTAHCTLNFERCTLNFERCTLNFERCTLYNKHCTLHTEHCTLHTEHQTPNTTWCELHAALHAVHFKLHTDHRTLNIKH